MCVSLCAYLKNIGHQMFIDGEDGDLQYGHDEELQRAGFTQNSPEGNQDCSCAEVCIDYPAGQERQKLENGEHITYMLIKSYKSTGNCRKDIYT